MRQGFLIVNHGTLNNEIKDRTITEFALSVSDRFEDAIVTYAYTDQEVRQRLREQTGEKVRNLKAAILNMKEMGVTDLAIISTDIHDGTDYRRLKEETVGLAALFSNVSISAPLLYSEKDYELVARATHGAFSELLGDDVLILVTTGHKTDGAEELAGFEKSLKKYIDKGYVASLRGERRLYKVIKELKQNQIESGRVILVPMEFMAGKSVENDVSQEYTDLVQRLIDDGYTVEEAFRGLAEYDEYQRIYLKHLYDSMR